MLGRRRQERREGRQAERAVEGRLAHSMRVLIAGGGIPALEALAGLRALAGDRIEATLLAPDPVFSYRPLSGAVPFHLPRGEESVSGRPRRGSGGRLVRDRLAQVDEDRAVS